MKSGIDLFTRFCAVLRSFSLRGRCGGLSFLLAVSGGPDSMAMLDLFDRYKRTQLVIATDVGLFVATFNHMLRPEAEAEVEFVREVCRARNLEFFTDSGDVRKFAETNGLSIEEAGRVLRYQFLEKIAQERGVDFICTAHTASDLLETMLLRLTKGTGPFGLGSMKPLSGKYLRPLLSFTKEEILNYLHENGIQYVIDSSNLDEKYQRNLLRQRVVPVLKSINPRLDEAALRLAKSIWELDDFLERILERYIQSSVNVEGRMIFRVPEDDFLLIELVRRLALKFFGRSVDSEKLERLKRCKRPSFKVSFWGPLGVEISHGWGMLGDIRNYPSREVEIGPGESSHSFNGYFITLRTRGIIDRRMVLRTWKEGDRTRVGRKVKEIFGERKFPTFARRLVPLIDVDGIVCWIAGVFEDKSLMDSVGICVELKGGLTFEP